MSKPIPKSLHTVTVFVRMANMLFEIGGCDSREQALDDAISNLGYADTPDTHELRAKALAQLNA